MKQKIKANDATHFKLVITKNFSNDSKDQRVYLNQVMLYENLPIISRTLSNFSSDPTTAV